MTHESVVQFVCRSEARVTVLEALATDARSAGALVSTLSLSRSGVYKALDELSDRDLVRCAGEDGPRGNDWSLTGPGLLVVDQLERHDWVGTLLADREYWLNHDISGLPDRFRRRLPAFRNADVLRNPDNDPRYLERYWTERMPDADRLWVGSRVIHGSYADAMDEQTGRDVETRLVHHAPVLDQFFEQYSTDREEFASGRPDSMDERVCHIPCSFMLTEDLFTLSFPLHSGEYDQDSVLVGRDTAALRFGEDFFAFYWEQATPIDRYLFG
jgi:predicted transcriptional regulator